MKRIYSFLLFLIFYYSGFSQSCVNANYPFNGNPDDVSGNSNGGTALGGVSLSTDRFGNTNKAYSFDGVDDGIIISDNSTLDLGGQFTLSAWIYPTAYYSAPLGNGRIIDKPNTTLAEPYSMYNMMLWNDGKIHTSVSIGGFRTPANNLQGNQVVPLNQWTHVLVSYTGSTLSIYLNGILDVSTPVSGTIDSNNESLSIGYYQLANNFFNGSIDDVKIMDCGLSSTQVDSLFSAESVQNCLVADLPFSNNANDYTGNNNNGTINGAIFSQDRFGNPNSAMQFDGVDDHINLGSSSTTAISGNQLTLSAWIYPTAWKNNIYEGNIINKEDFNLAGYVLRAGNNGNLDFWVHTGAFVGIETSNSPLVLNQWQHLAGVYNGSKLVVFVNGQPIDSITAAGNITPSAIPLWIGGSNYFSNRHFPGKIDDVQIYDCALTYAEINSLFNLSSPQSPCNLSASAVSTPPTCHNGNNGSVNLTVTGGTTPIVFQWSNGSTNEDLSAVGPGNYSVVINDASGCDTMFTVSVNNPTALGLNVSSTSPSCGQANGTASVTVSGGTSPLSITWSNGDTGSSADSLAAGSFMVTVTDAVGCSASNTFGLNNTSGPSLSTNVTPASCQGVFDGAIDLTVSGGTSPYTYTWTNGSTTEDLTNIKSGSYMVEVTDAAGCTSVLTVVVGTNSIDLSSSTTSNPTCGNTDGSISVVASGTSPFTYQWGSNAGSATTASVSNLGSGMYYVTVTDANGCSVNQSFNLSNPNGPALTLASVTPSSCSGGLGSINVNVISGTPPFTYNWSNGATTQDLTGLAQGNYDLEVTGGNGCKTMLSVNVPGILPDPITLCMSTVDSASGKVLCVWEKAPVGYMSHFNIYRENAIAGQYDFWFTKPYDSLSQWTDQSANPVVRGWRYKVTQVDTCGNESPFGINHKTLHLVSSRGLSGEVNLIWDTYEGFNYPTVYINRFHSSTGWQLIDSVPSNLHTYTDLLAPSSGNLLYTVDVKPPATCVSTRAINHNSTRSNRGTIFAPTGVPEENNLFGMVSVFPNPTTGDVFIHLEKEIGNIHLRIMDISGKEIYQKEFTSDQIQFNISNTESGIYLLEIRSGNLTYRDRLIKQ